MGECVSSNRPVSVIIVLVVVIFFYSSTSTSNFVWMKLKLGSYLLIYHT